MSHEKLHVIAVISNARGYSSRYRLYRQFEHYMRSFANVVLWTAELAYGEQEYVVTDSENPHHFQFRVGMEHVLWHKENLINAVVKRLPRGCKYLMACDADLIFADPLMPEKVIMKLKEFHFVQPFSETRDLMPNHTCDEGRSHGYVYRVLNGMHVRGKRYGSIGSPGYCWAFTRTAWEMVGGLPDFPILGSADFFMASGLLGIVDDAIRMEVGGRLPHYQKKLYEWQARALEKIQGKVSYLEGSVFHYWHGNRAKRGYRTRNERLICNEFHPDRDIRYNSEGILEFTGTNPGLEKDVAEYFGTRDEDGLDTAKIPYV